jgi:formate dehydrogenase iron-sulfur subunit
MRLPVPTNPWARAEPRPPERTVGFLTDSTICIGCKACEVACKQWNRLPADGANWLGISYDNTGHLGGDTWRHVKFLEQFDASREGGRWLFISDVCKHCEDAGCMNVCPTGAIVRTEFGTVFVQDDICNGCGYCVGACPFGVIARSEVDHGAHKCTLCYDRLQIDEQPACAKACPTGSIAFGPLDELAERGRARVAELQGRGATGARLWGDSTELAQGLHALFVLSDDPRKHGLPVTARTGRHNLLPSYAGHLAVGLAWAALSAFSLRRRARR